MKQAGVPAFPQTSIRADNDPFYRGMSLRDYFAGQALAGLLAGIKNKKDIRNNYHHAADEAYGYADAMLKERIKDDNQSPN